MENNLSTLLCASAVISGFGYAFVILLLHSACRKVRGGESHEHPFVSVIIAARNERTTLGVCLSSVMDQTYLSDRYEVIVVDDRSTDGTGGVINRFSAVYGNLSGISVDVVPPGVSPKKNALSLAIRKAKGEIVLQTDADCIISSGWIAGMAGRFEAGIDMVAGVAPYIRVPGALNSFVCHEYLWNVFLSAGSIVLGSGTHASARNLGFRREAFMSVGGYGAGAQIKSGDDTLLLHRIQKKRKSAVATLPDPRSYIFTNAPTDFRAFFRQRTRHMSTGRYFAPLQVLTGCIVYGFHILILLTLFFSVWSKAFLFFAVLSFLLKIAVDVLIIHTAKNVFGLSVDLRKYVVNEAYMILYMAVMPLVSMIIPVRWKENS